MATVVQCVCTAIEHKLSSDDLRRIIVAYQEGYLHTVCAAGIKPVCMLEALSDPTIGTKLNRSTDDTHQGRVNRSNAGDAARGDAALSEALRLDQYTERNAA